MHAPAVAHQDKHAPATLLTHPGIPGERGHTKQTHRGIERRRAAAASVPRPSAHWYCQRRAFRDGGGETSGGERHPAAAPAAPHARPPYTRAAAPLLHSTPCRRHIYPFPPPSLRVTAQPPENVSALRKGSSEPFFSFLPRAACVYTSPPRALVPSPMLLSPPRSVYEGHPLYPPLEKSHYCCCFKDRQEANLPLSSANGTTATCQWPYRVPLAPDAGAAAPVQTPGHMLSVAHLHC
ncbi:hypothetical protein HPB48_008029 [Haemaphysalis longicornis]|uniref:Uncharacterized protein n=1 Tax=Haemaphysalis longicornis TaxID=44386 RepID=A0A9J6G0R2_HAELO|nr:hypothetical protein HPB48_008029 [Haemaphysalis longicornis]